MSDTDNTINIEELFSTPVDMAEAEDVAAEASKSKEFALLPDGNYITMPPAEPKARADFNGRPVANFFMSVIKEDDESVTGKVAFDLSPVTVLTDKGRADKVTAATAGAAVAYQAANIEAPGTFGDVVQFVATTPVRLRVGTRKAGSYNGTEYKAKNVVYNIMPIEE